MATVLHHKDLNPWLDRLASDPCYRPGKAPLPRPSDWHQQTVALEFPIGELTKPMMRLVLVGRAEPEVLPIDGSERFDAQGLEGKVRVRKPLVNALLNMNLLPEWRGRIVIQ